MTTFMDNRIFGYYYAQYDYCVDVISTLILLYYVNPLFYWWCILFFFDKFMTPYIFEKIKYKSAI